jgi:hypothetical protein
MVKVKNKLLTTLLIASLGLSLVSVAAHAYTQQEYTNAKIYAVGACPASNFSTLRDQLNCINSLLTSWGYPTVSSIPQ